MEKTVKSRKVNDVTTTGKKRTCDNKQQTTSETSNLDSTSSSYNTFSENAESKTKKSTRLRNVEEKSSLSSDEYENSKVSVGKRKKKVTRSQREEVGANSNGGNSPEEPSESQEQEEENDVNETSLQSHRADDSSESDMLDYDVKVCDICGDAGRDDLLGICCRCPDGAEHTYCMRILMEKVPVGDWVCEECKAEEKKNRTNRQKFSSETEAEKDQSSDPTAVKVSGKRRADELESSSSFKKRALDPNDGSTKDVDRGKVKSNHQVSSDSVLGNDSSEAAHSPATRPRLQSLKGAFFKSKSFSNARSKIKLVDDIVLQRQKSTKERSSHEAREMGKSTSFRSSTNLGRFGPSGSKVKMLSPNSSHVQDLKSLKNKKERTFERTNSIKSSSSNSAALTPKADKLPASRGETALVSSGSNSEVRPLKGDSKTVSGLKPTSRSNLGPEVPVSLGTVNKQLPSSPTRVGPTSSAVVEQRSNALKDDNPSKLTTSKESTSLADVIKEITTSSHLGSGLIPGPSGVPSQNNKQTGHSTQGSIGNNASGNRNSKEVKNRDNKLKDAIEAALLKKPGIYRKKVSDQPDESSVSNVNNELPFVDRIPHSRNAGSLTSSEVANDWHTQISRSSNIDHSKQSNGNNFKQPMIPPAEGKHLTTGLSNLDDVALSSLLKSSAVPDHECIWQGSFEINRSGKSAEFWDGLQAHLSSCASPRVFEAVNNLPQKILLNGVSRVSAWPTQFENSGVKEDNIAIYFFAKDLESYEKSYQVLLDDMIRGDLALIGSINGVELLIFPSNQLPEKSNRWNMLFFLWGVFRGKKKNPLQVPDGPEKNCIPQAVASISTDKMSSPEDACLPESTNKDKNVDSEPKDNLKLPIFSQEKTTNNISSPLDSVNIVPAVIDANTSKPNKTDGQDLVKLSQNQVTEPKKRSFIDLSEDNDDDDDDFITAKQRNTWCGASGQTTKEENVSKKQKSELYGQNSNFNTSEPKENTNNGERHFFPLIGSSVQPQKVKLALDLNECLVGETDNIIMTKKDNEDDDVASSLSLSLAFSPPKKDDEDRGKGKCHSTSSMLLFRDMVDK